jgi:uncharacterized ion transporter superfamily protein YfcC
MRIAVALLPLAVALAQESAVVSLSNGIQLRVLPAAPRSG